MIRRGQIEAHHQEERVQKALGLAQRQVEDEAQGPFGVEEAVDLAYLGIATDIDGTGARVLGLDRRTVKAKVDPEILRRLQGS